MTSLKELFGKKRVCGVSTVYRLSDGTEFIPGLFSDHGENVEVVNQDGLEAIGTVQLRNTRHGLKIVGGSFNPLEDVWGS